MNDLNIQPAVSKEQIETIASLAFQIWHQHFIPIIGSAQVDYMLEKFQSFPALEQQINEGYEYFILNYQGKAVGYTGVHQENNKLFLSKIYLLKEYRGKRISSSVFDFLIQLCKDRGLSNIWLTCNKNNQHTIAIYQHLGFNISDVQKADIGNGFVMDDYIMELEIS